jgi:hypothetical protein
MKEVLILGAGLLLCFGICITGPLVALAEMHEVTSHPVTRCGLHCVIQTYVCDTELEASVVAKKHNALVYELGSQPGKYFVDVMMTEAQANLIE